MAISLQELLEKVRASKHHDAKEPTGPSKSNYYKPKWGAQAAEILNAWRKDNYRTTQIPTANLQVQPTTLRFRLIGGLDWLCDNISDPEALRFYQDMRRDVRFTINSYGVVISLVADPIKVMRPIRDVSWPEMQTDFLTWIASDPCIGAKWPEDEREFYLLPDQVEWFEKQARDLNEKGFGLLASIEPTAVAFRRYPRLVFDKPNDHRATT